jgi:transcriptional regulator with XRE-family HTH domain
MTIGKKIRSLRLEKGYSQEYLADVLAVSQKTYSNIENDKSSIKIDALIKIAEEFKIDFLFEGVVINHISK